VKDLLDDAWSLAWTGGCAVVVFVLYACLCAGPIALTLIGRLFSAALRKSKPGQPADSSRPTPQRPRHPWAFKGLPLGPRWQ
jgi:hypothetical protein